jgi:Holliday junction resolvase RusA-like endonuclease
MASIEIRINGEPIAQARHRSSSRGGIVRQYDPTAAAKKEMLKEARKQHPNHTPFTSALSASIIFCFARPSSHYRSNGDYKEQFKNALPCKRPDVDNCIKSMLDSMNGFVYLDDKQVVTIAASKVYGQRAYTWAKFTEL